MLILTVLLMSDVSLLNEYFLKFLIVKIFFFHKTDQGIYDQKCLKYLLLYCICIAIQKNFIFVYFLLKGF